MPTKRCRYCAEEIQEAATLCRFCGRSTDGTAPPPPPQPPAKTSCVTWGCLLVVVFGLGILLLVALGKHTEAARPISEPVQVAVAVADWGPWRHPESREFTTVGRALVKAKRRDCGEYYLRQGGSDRYLVGCTPDGTSFIVLDVNTATLAVGPGPAVTAEDLADFQRLRRTLPP